MIHPEASETTTVRTVFIIGPDKKVRLTLTYPASIGRNIDEILRVLDALQLSSAHSVSTPVDWHPGDDVIVSPAIDDEHGTNHVPGRSPHAESLPSLHATTGTLTRRIDE